MFCEAIGGSICCCFLSMYNYGHITEYPITNAATAIAVNVILFIMIINNRSG